MRNTKDIYEKRLAKVLSVDNEDTSKELYDRFKVNVRALPTEILGTRRKYERTN